MRIVLLRTSSPVTNLNSDYATLVNQYGVFEAPGAFFVIPTFDTGVFGYAVNLDFCISPVLVEWFTTNAKYFAGGVSSAYQLSPTTKTVC